MKKALLKVINKLGYQVTKYKSSYDLYPDIKEQEFWDIYHLCKPYTMTSVERMYSLYCAIDYILSNRIEGDFVECGVWRGGSAMLMAQVLSNRKITDRKVYLYDTFEGMSPPTSSDVTYRNEDAGRMMAGSVDNKENSVWCLADVNDVKNNMSKTTFPGANLVYVQGKVEDTLPAKMPTGKIALLRLDTDWYESTKHELNILYPIVAEKGVIIIDDYGHWQGCRKAVDEYIEQNKIAILLNRIDYTGRIAIKGL